MFTGLIQDVGTVERVVTGAVTDLFIRSAFPAQELALGESIACDGCCLTVVQAQAAGQGSVFQVQAAPETLRRTHLGRWHSGTRVNLERAMRLSDRLGGHLVSGHVDGVSAVVERRAEGGSLVMTFELPSALALFFIEKGSVAIDGVSLTVKELFSDRFSVMLIPETQARTTLAGRQVGEPVHLEADLIGKYVARQLGSRAGSSPSGLTEEALRRAGFAP